MPEEIPKNGEDLTTQFEFVKRQMKAVSKEKQETVISREKELEHLKQMEKLIAVCRREIDFLEEEGVIREDAWQNKREELLLLVMRSQQTVREFIRSLFDNSGVKKIKVCLECWEMSTDYLADGKDIPGKVRSKIGQIDGLIEDVKSLWRKINGDYAQLADNESLPDQAGKGFEAVFYLAFLDFLEKDIERRREELLQKVREEIGAFNKTLGSLREQMEGVVENIKELDKL